MTQYVVAITFPDNAVTYQAYSQAADSPIGTVVTAAALVERLPDGQLRIVEGADSEAGSGLTGGSLIGLVVGILGGPVGMLLGWGLGALVGSAVDVDRAEDQDDALGALATAIAPGRNAILAETDETDTAALDEFVARYGGVVHRRLLDDVLAELEAQQQAQADAAAAARAAIKQQRKEERHERREERIAKLKAAFGDDSASSGATRS